MSVFYKLHGEIGLRKGPEVVAIIKKLKSKIDTPYGLEVSEYEPGFISLMLDVYESFAGGGVLDLDELLKSLGPYTLEPAVLFSVYDHEEEDVLVVAATEPEERETLSRHRFEQIAQLIRDLIPEDRARLAAMAAGDA
jgi:hypothetical protein